MTTKLQTAERKVKQFEDKRAELAGELDKVRSQLLTAQGDLSSAYLNSRPTDRIETKLVKLRARETALVGALESADSQVDAAGDDLAGEQLKADSRKITAIIGDTDALYSQTLLDLERLLVDINTLYPRYLEAQSMSNRSDDLTTYRNNNGALGFTEKWGLLRQVEHACKQILKTNQVMTNLRRNP